MYKYLLAILLLPFALVAQNTVVKQTNDIYLVNESTNAVALKIIKPANNLGHLLQFGTQTNTWFSVNSTGAVVAGSFAGDGSQLTGISGGGGSFSGNPFYFTTNETSQVNLKTNKYTLKSSISFVTDASSTNWTIINTNAIYSVGYVRVIGRSDGSPTNYCDVTMHVDALPFAIGSAPAICQFQGALSADSFSLQVSHSGAGMVKLTLGQTNVARVWQYTVQGYGENLPDLVLSNTNSPTPLTFMNDEFYAVNGQIAADTMMARQYAAKFGADSIRVIALDVSGNILFAPDQNLSLFQGAVQIDGETTINNTLTASGFSSDSGGLTIGSGKDLTLGNTAVEESITPTHTLLLKDAAGNTYKVGAALVAP